MFSNGQFVFLVGGPYVKGPSRAETWRELGKAIWRLVHVRESLFDLFILAVLAFFVVGLYGICVCMSRWLELGVQ